MKSFRLNSRDVQNFLNGFLCVYKPRDLPLSSLKKRLRSAICAEGNELDEVIVPEINIPIVENHRKSQASVVVGQSKQLDYVLHPLMSGPIFFPEDIYLQPLHEIEPSSSGICVFGIGNGCDDLESIRNRSWLNEYLIHGELGVEKYKHEIRGKIIAKALFDNVTNHKIRKLFSKIKMQYKRISYELANVEIQSQEAFEIAQKGAPRPRVLGTPIVFDINLKQFNPPNIIISVQVVGEDDYFLRALMHEIGCSLETLACTKKLRYIRQGPFTLNHSLLEKHFKLVSIIKNIQMCNKIIKINMAENPEVIKTRKVEYDETKEFMSLYGQNNLSNLEEPKDCLHFIWDRSYD